MRTQGWGKRMFGMRRGNPLLYPNEIKTELNSFIFSANIKNHKSEVAEMNKDNENLTALGRLILNIADRKGINERQLSKRVGYKDQQGLHSRLKNDMRISILCSICDGLGVELCIVDGWEKITLNDFKSNKDLDVFMANMKLSHPSLSNKDRWLDSHEEEKQKIEEQKRKHREVEARRRAKDREAFNEYYREYNKDMRIKKALAENGDKCATCRYTEPRLEKNGYLHYCTYYEDYKACVECDDYESKPTDISIKF